MTAFDKIKKGLEEAISYEKGEINARTAVISVSPTDTFTPEEIRRIRMNAGFTQVVFANYIGVSVKTVEAWESGRNHPKGAACRLLTLTRDDPQFPEKSGIVLSEHIR